MTPYRICIIGDSHVAAFKNGWDRIAPRYPHVEMSYFAKASTALMDMTHDDTWITLKRARDRRFLSEAFGYRKLDTSRIDCFLCVGMMESSHALIKMQAEHKLARQCSFGRQYVSEAAYLAAYKDIFETSVLKHVVQELSQLDIETAFVTLDPRPSAEILQLERWSTPVYDAVISEGVGRQLSGLVENFMQSVLPAGFSYLPPPHGTLLENVLTKQEFSSGSARLHWDKEHKSTDVKHMNAEYGMRVLTSMFESLGIEPRETPERNLHHDG